MRWLFHLFRCCLHGGLYSWLVIVLLAGCTEHHRALPNDAYIWQRQWTPALVAAVRGNAALVSQWRVLAAQVDVQGHWLNITPDWAALAATGRPVIAVVRIEGQLAQWDERALLAGVQNVLMQWRGHGLTLAGVEIDHDCATSRLPGYAHFLGALHAIKRANERLSITALPTWLNSADLDTVLAQVDEAVLQVHAVQSPRAGLFDPNKARVWMADFAHRIHKPWRVALPAYGSRVSWDEQGAIANIESEQPSLVSGADASELFAEPQTVQRFVTTLEADAPRNLIGIAWFRLPTDDDTRAWSMASWHAVLARIPLKVSLQAQVRTTHDAQLHDLLLLNTGTADVPLPALLRVDTVCDLADGINGYTLQRTAQGLFLQRNQTGLLRAGRQLNIGWLRCGQGGITLHIGS